MLTEVIYEIDDSAQSALVVCEIKALSFALVLVNQIEQAEQKYPNDIDDVPLQTDYVFRREVGAREVAQQSANEQPTDQSDCAGGTLAAAHSLRVAWQTRWSRY